MWEILGSIQLPAPRDFFFRGAPVMEHLICKGRTLSGVLEKRLPWSCSPQILTRLKLNKILRLMIILLIYVYRYVNFGS